METTKLQKR